MKDIDFTFGIITDAEKVSCERLIHVLQSIKNLNIPNYEIILVGNKNKILQYLNYNLDKINIIDFNENIKDKWITRKKNIITQNAKYDNIVYLHDYFVFDNNWYNGWKTFGENYVACMNIILNYDGKRFRDWSIFHDHEFLPAGQYAGWNRQKLENLIPYNETELNRYQYFSGSYWVAKKSLMLEMPLNENLTWGQGEDVVWSQIFRRKYKFSMNPNSIVKVYGKTPDVIFSEMPDHVLNKLKEYVRR